MVLVVTHGTLHQLLGSFTHLSRKYFALEGSFLVPPPTILPSTSVVSLLMEALSRDISNLVVRLDSQLVVMQLTNRYHIRNPTFLRHYLRVRLLECRFQIITYEHVPRELNTVVDSLANYVLDWNLSHSL